MKKLIIVFMLILFDTSISNATNMIMVNGTVECYDNGCVVYEKGSDKSYFLGKFNKLNNDTQKCIDSEKDVLISGVLIKTDEFNTTSVMCEVTGK